MSRFNCFCFFFLCCSLPLCAGVSYFRGGAALFHDKQLGYSAAIGSRYGIGPFGALDLSWEAMWAKKEQHHFYATPRAGLFAYLNPCHSWALYAGGALSWAYSSCHGEDGWRSGPQWEAAAGIEIGHGSPYCMIVELSRSLPNFQLFGKEFRSSHRPFTSLTLAVGF